MRPYKGGMIIKYRRNLLLSVVALAALCGQGQTAADMPDNLFVPETDQFMVLNIRQIIASELFKKYLGPILPVRLFRLNTFGSNTL